MKVSSWPNIALPEYSNAHTNKQKGKAYTIFIKLIFLLLNIRQTEHINHNIAFILDISKHESLQTSLLVNQKY